MNKSERLLVPIIVLVSAFASSQVLGLPPDSDTANWKGPRNNCYNYATDTKSNDFKQPGGLPWPNVGAALTAAEWCAKVKARAIGDGLVAIAWVPGAAIPDPPAGYNLVALGGLAGNKGGPGSGDYHWWRRNGDGTWSHKRGGTPAKETYTDGGTDGVVGDDPATPTQDESADDTEVAITDPRAAVQRDGYDLCCFMGVAKAPAAEEPDPSAPEVDEVRTGPITQSGAPSPGQYLRGADILTLELSLPTFAPGNQVPDPQWTGVLAGDAAGHSVWPGISVPSFPPYMRVFRGVVAVYADLDGTTITYYNDDNGLETALSNLIPLAGASCDVVSGDCAEITEREARGFGWQYQGDGVFCADVDCAVSVIPTISEWGLMVMTLLLLTLATVALGRHRRPAAA